MKKFSLMILAAMLLSACDNGVPHVEDPYNPVDFDGKPINGTEFNKKYCAGKIGNETCAKVRQATMKKSTKGKMPDGY